MAKKSKDKEPLTPRDLIDVKGKIHYSESSQAWSMIKLKTEFLKEFKQLKEKRSKFSYEMVYSRDKDEILKKFKESLKDKRIVPIIMYLYRDKKA